MSDSVRLPAPAAEEIIRLIKTMTPKERQRLINHMEFKREWLLGYVMVPVELLDLFGKISENQHGAMRKLIEQCVDMDKLLGKYRKGPRRRAVLKNRNREIEKAMEVGISQPPAIFKFMVENHPELMRKSKQQGFISVESMMKGYRTGQR